MISSIVSMNPILVIEHRIIKLLQACFIVAVVIQRSRVTILEIYKATGVDIHFLESGSLSLNYLVLIMHDSLQYSMVLSIATMFCIYVKTEIMGIAGRRQMDINKLSMTVTKGIIFQRLLEILLEGFSRLRAMGPQAHITGEDTHGTHTCVPVVNFVSNLLAVLMDGKRPI